jgi:Tfp pilus assembly protein PilV
MEVTTPAAAPAPHGERAFTLISVMIALILLVTGLLALGRSQTGLVKTQSSFASRARAYQLARQATEQLRAQPPATIASTPTTPIDTLGNPTASSLFTRTVTVTSDTTNLFRVIVSVAYPGQVQPVSITTLVYH